MNIKSIFNTNKPVIGAIHFMPLIGYKEFKGLETTLEKALNDLGAIEDGGADAIIIENNYDLPHKVNVGPETVAAMTYLGLEIRKRTELPIGVSVLWNDYKAALSIAKVISGEFIRVPVFVDNVVTDFGEINAKPTEVVNYRKSIGCENISLFTDIHVKHAMMLEDKTLTESAKEAEENRADALIVTGSWTGKAPLGTDIEEVKKVTSLPVIIGSGLDPKNASLLFKYADGAIVSTSIKDGEAEENNRNIKPYDRRINKNKVEELMKEINKLR